MKPSKPLYIKGSSSLSLFVTKNCPSCGKLVVHGSAHQLGKTLRIDERCRVAWVEANCHKCGHVWAKKIKLTTGRGERRRLIDWYDLGWKITLSRWFPWKWRGLIIWLVFWLEGRIKI